MIQITFVLLILIALIHFYWVAGGEWGLDKAIPIDNAGIKLSNFILVLTALVGIVMLGFAYVAYSIWQKNINIYIVYAGYSIGFTFLLRALGEFNLVGILKKKKDTTFAKYDTFIYIPLCLFIGFSYIIALLPI